MGQPYFQIKRFCDENGVKIFSSNYALYSDMSHRVMSILRETVPHIEVYSVDEAFIGFDTADTEILAKTGRRIVERVLRCTGIPVSVGISPSKTLAKIASKLSKQYPRLNGMCLMYRKEDVEKVLKNFPVGDVWGIGRRLSARLVSMGYSTAWDFYRMGKESARHIGGIGTERTWEELHGTSCIELETEERNRQQICVSRSFAPKLNVAEDPVCGSGHCHIFPYWTQKLGKNELVAYQASKRGGVIYARLADGRCYLSGKAALFAKAEIFTD